MRSCDLLEISALIFLLTLGRKLVVIGYPVPGLILMGVITVYCTLAIWEAFYQWKNR